MDIRNVCPNGWHVSSDTEWTQLENYLIEHGFNNNDVGKALKSDSGWDGTNDYDFNALPAGRMDEESFSLLHLNTFFWSNTEYTDNSRAWIRYLALSGDDMSRAAVSKKYALSVRCIKD